MRALMFTLFLFAFSCLQLTAQESLHKDEVDRISFEQFQKKQFKELKTTLKQALENKIDFYYLRLRAGILAYDNKNYEYAIPQFRQTLEFFPSDTLSKEYLYYAYLFSDRKETAHDFASKQTESFQRKVGYKKKPFDFVGIDGGAMITSNITSNRGKIFKTDAVLGKSERTLNGNLFFGDFFFQNTVKNRLHINNSFSFFYTQALYEIEVLLPFNRFKAKSEFNNLNFQYNFGLSYTTQKEWTIAAGFGFYRIKGNTFTAVEPDTINNRIPIISDTTAINSFLGSVTVSKRCKHVQPYIQLSGSNLNNVTQLQAEAGLTYYPLGNYTFYGKTSGTYLRNGSQNQYVIGQKIGFKVLNWWWNELNFNYGNTMINYISNNGFLTYNTSDPIKLLAGINFNFYIKKHFQLGLEYNFQHRERTTQFYIKELAGLVVNSQPSNYFNHSIKTSLLWNF
ncbi:MAG: hypothetical protein IPM95_13985 [Sphingobacteriales bacterium]|nr:hypothetical protein [Sphingobacteriales bacterium]